MYAPAYLYESFAKTGHYVGRVEFREPADYLDSQLPGVKDNGVVREDNGVVRQIHVLQNSSLL